MNFDQFKQDVNEAYQGMLGKKLFIVDTTRELLWNTYLSAYPETERQQHNCNACRSFIYHYGKAVWIDEHYNIRTFWENVHTKGFEIIAERMAELIKSSNIANLFRLNGNEKFGCDHNVQRLESGECITWKHLYVNIPNQYRTPLNGTYTLGQVLGNAQAQKQVLLRSITELTDDALETTLDLINEGTLYRGAEFKNNLVEFMHIKKEALKYSDKLDNFCWEHYDSPVSKIRNIAFGTLLINLSEGMDVENAVHTYEVIMAPSNYKRPTAIITKRQIEAAQKTVEELGLTNALPRRHARIEDISVNNVLFVNRDARKRMKDDNIFSVLSGEQTVDARKYKEETVIPIEYFLEKVLPGSKDVEVLFENKHVSNLMTLTAPQNPDAGHLFKWNNNFVWVYNGSMADSIKEKVKAAGGNINATMRASLHWFNYDDLDIHCVEPGGNQIYYGNRNGRTGGKLDVDMNAGECKTRDAVENIAWVNNEIPAGRYQIIVNNFCKRESVDVGFEVEIEVFGILYNFSYDKAVADDSNVHVADIVVNWDGSAKVEEYLKSTTSVRSSKEWNIDTAKFQKVSCIMMSPNYWDDNHIGNKHYFFMIDGCQNPEPVRGFFNEYLRPDLERDHKRVFEAIGSRAKTEFDENQLSGLGFSSTQHTELIVKVDNKVYKIKF